MNDLSLVGPLTAPWLQTVGGIVIVPMGLAMLTGSTTSIALWTLRAFPFLRGVG